MAFIVADGSNLDSANTYSSVEFADDYLSDNSLWPQAVDPSDPEYNADDEATKLANKQLALKQSTQGLDLMYGELFIGNQLVFQTQLLEWPRTFYQYGTIPTLLRKATAEFAVDIYNGGSMIREMNTLIQVSERSVEGAGFKKQEKYRDSSITEYRQGMLKVELLLRKLTNDLEDNFTPPYLGR